MIFSHCARPTRTFLRARCVSTGEGRATGLFLSSCHFAVGYGIISLSLTQGIVSLMAQLLEYVGYVHIFLGPYRGNPISLYLRQDGEHCTISPKVYPWNEVIGEGETPSKAAASFIVKWKARGLPDDVCSGPTWDGIKPEKPPPPPKPAAPPKPATATAPTPPAGVTPKPVAPSPASGAGGTAAVPAATPTKEVANSPAATAPTSAVPNPTPQPSLEPPTATVPASPASPSGESKGSDPSTTSTPPPPTKPQSNES